MKYTYEDEEVDVKDIQGIYEYMDKLENEIRNCQLALHKCNETLEKIIIKK